jgi:asparagine synthase (glutamine-hydrolysing)
MCAIVGIADLKGRGRPDPRLVATMAETMAHRGPDGDCVVEVGAADTPRLAFGFRRLSIVDFGAGARAYADESGRLRVICNGEIYNEPELRRDLIPRGHRFETACDTEVIPHLYEEHGLSFVSRLNGMFAFAVFDAKEGRLVLGRDRAGEKPLYYLEQNGEVMFASEIKALLAHPRVGRQRDLHALTRYLLYGYFPAPYTPFLGVRKLPAGHLLIAERGRLRVEPYWDLRRCYEVRPAGAPGLDARGREAGPDEGEAAREVHRLLSEAVRLRLRADAPVGVFLSGGVDSTAIAALAVEIAGRSVPTFTLGFKDAEFDETAYARRVAARLGTEHHEMTVGEPEMMEALLQMARLLDEPLADASLVPTHLLSRFARRTIKVALGGEGGDELFAGYPTYLGDALARSYGRLPATVRGLLRRVVEAIPPSFGNVGIEYLLKRFVAAADLPPVVRHQVWFGAFPPDRQKEILSPEALDALASGPPDDPLQEARAIPEGLRLRHPLDALLLTDFLMYLQDDLLTKVDRASMAASLEVRAPFLHHPLVEYVASLPASMKLRGFTSKRILKKALAGHLSRETLTRRKRGFNIPLARFMHNTLAPLLHRALHPESVARAGLLRPEAVTTLLREHMERRRDHGRLLWNLLMLQLWHSRHFEGGALLNEAPAARSHGACP